MEEASHQNLSPEGIMAEALQEGFEVNPIREQPELSEAQQLVIDGFFKAMDERRE